MVQWLASYVCYSCTMRTYDRERNTNYRRYQRTRYIEAMTEAMGGGCRICGYNRCLSSLHFHHVDPTTKKDIVARLLAAGNWKKTVQEAAKCVLLCSNCHGEVHQGLVRCPRLRKYRFPKTALGRPGGRPKKCPVSSKQLGKLRSRFSLEALAKHMGYNRKTVTRWCRELLV